VAALSDSFLQLLVTMTRSEELERVTRPCALGGDETATKELKQTMIMFGEIVRGDGKGRVVRRVGFGAQDEVTPLQKTYR